MSELMQQMITDVHNEHATRLAHIEAAAGLIEEAETLAATLRSHGVTGARAAGYVTTGKALAYVHAVDATGDELRQALADAGLRIALIKRHNTFCDISLRGLDCWVAIDADAVDNLADCKAA